jgi:tRNA threonylcarbamoyladenosine biosynthesis protein TsaE
VSVLRTWHTASEDETIEAGVELALMLPSRAIVLLTGDLGAGKTTLTKGIAKGRAGISPDEVTSPTFTLIHEYAPNLIHMDLYRLETEREVLGLGFDDLLDREALLLVEWGERFPHLIPPEHYVITLKASTEEAREITLSKA